MQKNQIKSKKSLGNPIIPIILMVCAAVGLAGWLGGWLPGWLGWAGLAAWLPQISRSRGLTPKPLRLRGLGPMS